MAEQEVPSQSKPKHIEKYSKAGGANSTPDIVDVIGQYVQLERVGKVFQGRCPFHESDGKGRRRSLVVWPETQTFNCFKPGCRANVKSRNLRRRQNVLDFLELIGEIPTEPFPEPEQEAPQEEPPQEPVFIAEALPLPGLEPALLPEISYSMLEAYELCPLQFRYMYMEREKIKRRTRNMRLGLSIHNTLRKFYGLPIQSRTLSQLHQVLDESWQSTSPDVDEDAYWRGWAREKLEALYHSEEALTNAIIALEDGFDFPVEDFKVIGRVDRIDEISPGQYEVIDYKVLESDPADEQEAMDSLQSVCLYFGTHSLLRVFPVRIIYLRVDTGERISFTPTRPGMEAGLLRIKALVKEIQEATDFPATRNRFCSACQLHGRCSATR